VSASYSSAVATSLWSIVLVMTSRLDAGAPLLLFTASGIPE